MSNKIKAYYNEELESITIESDAKKGDCIQMSELTSFDKYIDKEVQIKYKSRIINDYKNSEEYKQNQKALEENQIIIQELKIKKVELENQIKTFDEKQKNLRLEAINEFKKSDEFLILQKTKEENLKLKEQLNQIEQLTKIKTIEDFKKSDEFLKIIKESKELFEQKIELENQIKDLNHNLNTFNLEKQNQLNEQKQKFDLLIKDKDYKINELNKEIDYMNKRKKEMSIKKLGEDFEQECFKMYNESLGQTVEDCIFKKAEIIDKTKPDFVFEVYTYNINEEHNENPLLGKVILEMKTEQMDSENKKTNKDHLKKLEKDRINAKADIALLVTELEREDNFYIKRDVEYKNIIIVRPEAMVSILSILRIVFIKNKDIVLQEIEFKDKQAIIDDFNKFKTDLLDKTIKNINNNVEEIIDNANKVVKQGENILKCANLIADRHIKTLENKINEFNIKKITNNLKD